MTGTITTKFMCKYDFHCFFAGMEYAQQSDILRIFGVPVNYVLVVIIKHNQLGKDEIYSKIHFKIVGNFEINKSYEHGSLFLMLMNHKDQKLGSKQSLSGENYIILKRYISYLKWKLFKQCRNLCNHRKMPPLLKRQAT